MKRIKKEKEIYFIGFKCSNDVNDRSLSWSITDVLNGKVSHNNHLYFLKDMFDHKSIIKIDVISYINGMFVPFSNVFSFRYGNGKSINEETYLESIESLTTKMKKFYKEKKYMKYCKRLFNIAKINHNEAELERLTQLFNSDCGVIYKVDCDLNTLIRLLEAGYKSRKIVKRISDELQELKSTVATINQIRIPKRLFDRFNLTASKTGGVSMLRSLKQLIKLTDKITQDSTLQMMKKLRIK